MDRDRRAGARLDAAVHRRLAAQLDPGARARLQRPGPADRRRDRQRRWRRRRPAATGARPGSPGCSTREIGGQISWLLPAALILLVGRPGADRARPRTDRARAGLVLWGGWLLVTGLIFSFMQGIFHAYYTVALAPAIGAVVGMGAARCGGPARDVMWALPVLAGTVGADRGLERRAAAALVRLTALAAGWPCCSAGLAVGRALLVVHRLPVRLGIAGRLLAGAASLAGPAAYAVQTAGTAAHRLDPDRRSHGRRRAGRAGRPARWLRRPGWPGWPGWSGRLRAARAGSGPDRSGSTGPGPTGQGQGGFGGGGRAGGGGMGGLLQATTPRADLVAALRQDASSYTWVAAAVGSNNAAGDQLATELPVMAVGGFNGSDPSPTLARFQQYVQRRQDPLLHRRRRFRRPAVGRQQRLVRDRRLGPGELHRHHGGRGHALRPLRCDRLIASPQETRG